MIARMSIIFPTQYSHNSQSLLGSCPVGTMIALTNTISLSSQHKHYYRRKHSPRRMNKNIPIFLSKCVFLSIRIVDLFTCYAVIRWRKDIGEINILMSGSRLRGCTSKILTNERPIGGHCSPFCLRR
jgi:hypothetical protein